MIAIADNYSCIVVAVGVLAEETCPNCSKDLLTIQEAFNIADFGKLTSPCVMCCPSYDVIVLNNDEM